MTNDAPQFSVITVCWNDLDNLKRTIDSVWTQERVTFEHIVIDGDSEDGTVEYLADLESPLEVDWQSEPDRGIFDAMNKGLSRASGKYCVFMNAGDVFTHNLVLQRVDSALGPLNALWGYGAIRYVTADGSPVGGALQFPFRQRKLELGMSFVPHQSMYVRVSALRDLGGFDTTFNLDADQELAMRLANEAHPVEIVDFLSDFLIGGAHENVSRLAREMSYHRMRRKNGVQLFANRAIDAAFAYACAGMRVATDRARAAVKDQ